MLKILKAGQSIEVFVEKLEDREGNIKVSHEKAIKMKSWEKLQKLYDNKERVKENADLVRTLMPLPVDNKKLNSKLR